MNESYPIFIASPDFSNSITGDALIALLLALLPIFIIGAFVGSNIWLAIIEIILIGLAEAIQFKLTKPAKPAFRIISFIVTYLILNLGYTAAIFISWEFPQKANLIHILGVGFLLTLAATYFFLSKE